MIELTNPSNLPDPSEIEYMEEPCCRGRDHGDEQSISEPLWICVRRGAELTSVWSIWRRHVPCSSTTLPLNEIIYDFFDALKSRSRGYASFDYEMKGYVKSDLVKLDILINKEEVDALSFIVFSGTAYERGQQDV